MGLMGWDGVISLGVRREWIFGGLRSLFLIFFITLFLLTFLVFIILFLLTFLAFIVLFLLTFLIFMQPLAYVQYLILLLQFYDAVSPQPFSILLVLQLFQGNSRSTFAD